ncbi:dTDP-4-dehydrorhamnose reductase [Streptomyces sp. CB01201]|uniref:dTDP-4-dehydrorhamnose reductase n=1 Tax=Streptomyces sp. CB01201 TaxID=2020324 RepID=UPI000C27A183|nr:dTDP-4-dehydrorhamnose reductase [Streptomyces sp. CB01201]PJM98530.1 dTDP-4-dehydrorhamnose reductase [Streptomyces sp. CB01201]
MTPASTSRDPSTTRWLITGAAGLLARELHGRLTTRGADVVALTRRHLDVTDARTVDATVHAVRPGVVVNCAAWTDVEGAEAQEHMASRVNAEGPRNLANSCARTGARLLHVSTDYVFPGPSADIGVPYAEDAAPSPGTAYGRTKLAGEREVLTRLPGGGAVVRTAWLYGRDGSGFVGKMLRRARAGLAVDVVADQYGQPTCAADVADRLIDLGALPECRAYGVFHATSAGWTSWYGLAREVFALAGADPALVRPSTSAEWRGAVTRPRWTVLSHGRWSELGLPPARSWRAALADELAAPTAQRPIYTKPPPRQPENPEYKSR